MKLLYGTNNLAKVESMRCVLDKFNVEIMGLKDLSSNGITIEVPKVVENGNSPLENAEIKARTYFEAFHIPVFSCDSGLYFENLPDEIQPGVHVRNVNGKCLTDDEMIEYYSGLAKKYGDITARYRNSICLVVGKDKVYKSMDENLSGEKFYIISKPHEKRTKGFPLNSLSVHIKSGKYYFDLTNRKVDDIEINKGFEMFFSKHIDELKNNYK